MPATKSATDTRRGILHAASQVIKEHSAMSLTLDAVSRTAGISKGGLLYHFPNKEALIEGMLRQYFSDFDTRLKELLEQEQNDTPGRWLRAYVKACFSEPPSDVSLITAGLAAVASTPRLLHIAHEEYAIWRQRAVEDGITSQTAMLVMQATDGVWFSETFGLQIYDAALRLEMMELLLQLIKENRS
ncbi:MAG: TetR/AcrR family transcriptional regulator [Chloroflexota bacterium]